MTTVLAVEDDPAILRGLSDNLRFEGYEVITASDGESGYQLQKEKKPDLIVLDLMLPRMSGLEFCRKLRGEGIQSPILMLTARSEEPDRVLGLDLAPTITSPSPSRFASCWPALGLCYGAASSLKGICRATCASATWKSTSAGMRRGAGAKSLR